MDLFTAVSLAFLLIYLVVGIYVARSVKTLDDFYVMDRKAPPVLIAGTLIATNVSSVTFIGFTGTAFSVGPLYVAFYGMTVVASLFVGLYLGRYLWRLKLWTIPDYFAKRFPSEPVRVVATAIVLISMVLYLISIMLGTQVAMGQLLGWPNLLSLIVVLGVITIFTFIGGMQGVVITDTICSWCSLSQAWPWPPLLSLLREGGLPRSTRRWRSCRGSRVGPAAILPSRASGCCSRPTSCPLSSS